MENQSKAIFGQKFVPTILPYIKGANSTIDIAVFDWRWYPNDIGSLLQTFNSALYSATRRGVRVRAIVNSRSLCKQIKNSDIDVRVYSGTKTLHTKIIVIDKKFVVCGSHNFTHSGFSSNHEASIITDDVSAVNDFSIFLNQLWDSLRLA